MLMLHIFSVAGAEAILIMLIFQLCFLACSFSIIDSIYSNCRVQNRQDKVLYVHVSSFVGYMCKSGCLDAYTDNVWSPRKMITYRVC